MGRARRRALGRAPPREQTRSMADHARTELATSPFDAPLEVAARRARDWVRGLTDRPVGPQAGLADLRAAPDVPLTDERGEPATVVSDLADDSAPRWLATVYP